MLRARTLFEIAIPALLVSWASMLVYSSILGETGYRALAGVEAERAAREAELDALGERRRLLEQRASQLSSKSLDGDLVDEKIRENLGYTRAGDVIIAYEEIDRLLAAPAAQPR